MSRIQQYVRVEEDWARTRVTSAQNRPPRKIANTEPKRDKLPPRNPTRFPRPRELGRVYTVFNEPIYRIMAAIKNEPFFIWSTPLGGDPSKRDPNKYCSYHQEKGHMTERCYSLKQHLEELTKAGHLRRYIGEDQKQRYHEGPTAIHNTKPAAQVIEMIHTSRPKGQSSVLNLLHSYCRLTPPSSMSLFFCSSFFDTLILRKKSMISFLFTSRIPYPGLVYGFQERKYSFF